MELLNRRGFASRGRAPQTAAIWQNKAKKRNDINDGGALAPASGEAEARASHPALVARIERSDMRGRQYD